jgi:hypothetical protein
MAITNNPEIDKKLLSLGFTEEQLDSYLEDLYVNRDVCQLVEDFLYCATPEMIRSDADACGVFDDEEYEE